MEPAIFLAELRLRLGVAEASLDTWYPRCDSDLDTYSVLVPVHLPSVPGRGQEHSVVRLLMQPLELSNQVPYSVQELRPVVCDTSCIHQTNTIPLT